jgi:hypothetical protein
MLQYLTPTASHIYLTGVSGQKYFGNSGAALLPRNIKLITAPAPTLPLIAAWNPLTALNDTAFLPFTSPAIIYTINGIQPGVPNYTVAGSTLTAQVAYALLSGIAIVFFFILSLCFVKPNPIGRLLARIKGRRGIRRTADPDLQSKVHRPDRTGARHAPYPQRSLSPSVSVLQQDTPATITT